MIGNLVAGKYQLLEKLRDGRFYDMYVARLAGAEQRYILKVLHKPFTDHSAAFASLKPGLDAVAALRHGGIIGLRDYGEDPAGVFLLEDYYSGTFLSDLLQSGRRIPTYHALDIGIKIVEAIGHAHSKGVCHGLLTPDSIVIMNDLTVRIGDFSCLASLSSTLSVSAEFQGKDIRYCSPEVISGLPPTFQSDLYSVGVVLYGLLTGRLPFHETNAVSMALEKLQGEAQSPRSLNPEIPPFLDTVILKAIRKKPSMRYASAQDLLSELLLCRTSLTRAMAENAPESGFAPAPSFETPAPMESVQPRSPDAPGMADPDTSDPDMEVDDLTGAKKPRKSRSSLTPLLVSAGIFLFLAVFGVAFLFKYFFGGFVSPGEVIVPDVTGKPMVEAKAILGNRNLQPVEASSEYSDQVPEGFIVRQDPSANAKVKEGRMVNLYVSTGKRTTAVPNIVNRSLKSAKDDLESAGLALGRREEQYSGDVRAGLVISQTPEAGATRPFGAKVSVVVSMGPEPVMAETPQATDMSVADARTAVEDAGFKVGREVNVPSAAGAPGTVVAQSVLPGSIHAQNDPVNLYVASEPTADVRPADGTVNLRISTSRDKQEVVIIVIDSEGLHEAYRESHRNEDQLRVPVSGVGPTRVLVYIDGSLIKEQSL